MAGPGPLASNLTICRSPTLSLYYFLPLCSLPFFSTTYSVITTSPVVASPLLPSLLLLTPSLHLPSLPHLLPQLPCPLQPTALVCPITLASSSISLCSISGIMFFLALLPLPHFASLLPCAILYLCTHLLCFPMDPILHLAPD